MSLIWVEISYEHHWSRTRCKKKIAHLVCDGCKKSMIKKFEIRKQYNTKNHFFCSRACLNESQKFGIIKTFKEKVFLENFGTTNPFKCESIKRRIKKTNLNRYGVENPGQSVSIRQRVEQTNLERFGTKNASSSATVKESRRQTFQERYGVDNAMQIQSVKENFDFETANKKANETKLKNGTFNKSSIEDEFYQLLVDEFGEDNIQRQVKIRNWNIDFYIKPLDRFVELDGVYWHGLDRPIEEIRKSSNRHSKAIVSQFDRDQLKNSWFRENKLVLERVTDVELKNAIKRKLI